MPLYEYQCDACGHRFEVIQKFSDTPLTECPECTGLLRKLLSSPAIHFKGTGWYITDYARKDGNGSPGAKDKPGAEKSGTSSEGGAKSETGTKADGGAAKSDTTTSSSTSM